MVTVITEFDLLGQWNSFPIIKQIIQNDCYKQKNYTKVYLYSNKLYGYLYIILNVYCCIIIIIIIVVDIAIALPVFA